ncbi:MAG: ABC transporter ATP-binding protein [Clostridium sp.]|nr:MAG: ABC transporter ATP-binding protein [Clostridium sp.]
MVILLSRVTNDVDTINMSLQNSLGTFIGAVALFIGCIIMMFTTNAVMAITCILSSIFGFAFMSFILKKITKSIFVRRQTELGKLNGHIEEIYSSHNIVKVYNGETESLEKFNELNNKVYDCNRKSQFLSGLMPPMMGFIGNFSYVAVCIVGSLLAIKGNITFGVIIAFIMYARLFTSPLSQIAQSMTQLQTVRCI